MQHCCSQYLDLRFLDKQILLSCAEVNIYLEI